MAGNGLVEESYICKLLEGGSLDTLKESGLRDEMFLTCKDQIQFIQKHEAEYKQLPDNHRLSGSPLLTGFLPPEL